MKKSLLSIFLIIVLIGGIVYLENKNNTSTISIKQYKNLELLYNDLEVTEKDIDTRMKKELKELVDYTTVKKRSVKKGDTVNIDYEGKLNGSPFDGGTDQGFDLVIGSNTFIPGFEDGVIGMKTGKTKDIKLTFPEDYQNEELAGQKVVFTVKVNNIKEKKLPEKITDKYISTITKKEYKTLKDYKQYITLVLQEEIDQENNFNKENIIWDEILDTAKVKELSKKEIKYYNNLFLSIYEGHAEQYQVDLNTFVLTYLNTTMEDFEKEKENYSSKTVTKFEIAKIIAKENNIKVTNEDVNNHIKENNINDEDIKNNKKYIKDELLLIKVNEFLLENTTFEKQS